MHKASCLLFVFVLLFSLPPGARSDETLPDLGGNDREAVAPNASGDADGVLRVRFTNGISARVFTSSYLERRTVFGESGGRIDLGDGRYLDVITDINDPRIANKGDGSFHPFDEELVVDAIAEISLSGLDMPLDIYILPFPRANLLMSSTGGSEIFLSPHVLEISRESAHYIVTHEVGHAFQNRYAPISSFPWYRYKQLRGIDNVAVFSESASHSYRPEEIFAEDFRVLFGGDAARAGGRIENPELPSPFVVSGLDEFFVALASGRVGGGAIELVTNYPNPFNPTTEIRIHLVDGFMESGRTVSVRIYDVRGRLIDEIFNGVPGGSDLRVSWNGRNARGEEVASAPYFCVVSAGSMKVTKKMLLIR